MRDKATSQDGKIATMLLGVLHKVAPRMQAINRCSMVLGVLLAILTLVNLELVLAAQTEADLANEAYRSCQQAVDELQETSDFLTTEARQYVSTGEESHLQQYLDEVHQRDRRGHALETLRRQATSAEAIEALEEARTLSDELAETELYALRLAAETYGLDPIPSYLAPIAITREDAALSDNDKWFQANELVYGGDYTSMKLQILDHVHQSSELLVQTMRVELDERARNLSMLLTGVSACVISLLLVVLFVIGSTSFLLLWPIRLFEHSVDEDLPLTPGGARELRHLAEAYNEMYVRNMDRAESLSFEAHNDALTGVLNRGAFNSLLTIHRSNSALVLVDVDNFKQFNDRHGHDMGDAILIEVSATLYASFRSTDHVCRIGGDEFAIIVTDVQPVLRPTIAHKLEVIADFLRDEANGLPQATVSMGVAFGTLGSTDEDLFQRADQALYEAKRRGRDCYVFYEELDATE